MLHLANATITSRASDIVGRFCAICGIPPCGPHISAIMGKRGPKTTQIAPKMQNVGQNGNNLAILAPVSLVLFVGAPVRPQCPKP